MTMRDALRAGNTLANSADTVASVKASTATNFAIAMDPAEVGAGTLDWARILPAAHAAGVRHFYVEQEAPFASPRMEAAARSAAYLARLKA